MRSITFSNCLRRSGAAFGCKIGRTLWVQVSRFNLSFILTVYTRARNRGGARRLVREAREAGFSIRDLVTCPDGQGGEIDYAQGVLDATSLRQAKQMIWSILMAASGGKHVALTTARRQRVLRHTIELDAEPQAAALLP